jgi:hypothetical protein
VAKFPRLVEKADASHQIILGGRRMAEIQEQRPLVDTGEEHLGTRFYIGWSAARQIALAVGWVDPEEHARLVAERDELQATVDGLAEQVAEKSGEVEALHQVIQLKRDRQPARQAVA